MCRLVGALFLVGLGVVLCVPLKDELMLDLGGDTAVVESTVREARQTPDHIEDLLKPGVKNAFIRTYGDKEGTKGGIHGYSKKLNDRGNEGYNHFDSFHKKDADKYGYEVHSEFGKSDKANVDVADENGKYSDDDKDKSDGQESKTLLRVSGESNGNKKHKNFLDDFDFVYFGDGAGASKYIGGGDESESGGGTSQSYETNESYQSGGSQSYDSGDKNEAESSSSDGKSQSLKAEDDDGESGSYAEEEEEGEDEY